MYMYVWKTSRVKKKKKNNYNITYRDRVTTRER